MSWTSRPLMIAAVLPVLVSGCSGTSTKTASPPSPRVSQTTNPLFSVASAYVVTASGDSGRQRLTKALASIGSMAGVQGASLTSRTTLQVDLSFTITQPERDAVLTRLRTLGKVDVPPGQH